MTARVAAVALAATFAGALTATPARAAAAPGAAPEIFPLAEVEPGLRGWGLSVFAGTRPERFDVEVLGVWRNVRPGTSYILARLAGRGLEDSGVISGMSGSPVYFGERLAGAVAFSWLFAEEAIAGITPIETMRGLLAAEAGGSAPAAAAGAPVDLVELVRPGPAARQRLTAALAALAAAPAEGARSGLLWTAGGFAPSTRALLGEALGPVAESGSAALAGGTLEPGAAVAGVLIDGDLTLAATGTVTDRLGDRILAFGHAFLGQGPLSLPMAGAEVVTVVPTLATSFKVSNLGPPVGAFDFDHQAGMRGLVGEVAPTVPLTVSVRGEAGRAFDLRVARLPQLTPVLMAIGVLGALDTDPASAGNQGLDLEARFDLGDAGELEVRQSFDGPGANLSAAIHLLSFAAYLLQNPLAEVGLEQVAVEVDHFATPRTARLVGAHATRTLVRPGQKVGVHLDFAAYRGPSFRRSLEIELPTSLPEGPYHLLVGDGMSIDAARFVIQPAEPVSLRQALDLLRSLHSRREVVVLGVFGGAGLSVAGEILPRLPDSVRSLWSAAASGSAVPLQLSLAREDGIQLDVPVEGIVRIDLEVERREPIAAAGDRPSPGDEPAAGPEPAAEPVETGGGAEPDGEGG